MYETSLKHSWWAGRGSRSGQKNDVPWCEASDGGEGYRNVKGARSRQWRVTDVWGKNVEEGYCRKSKNVLYNNKKGRIIKWEATKRGMREAKTNTPPTEEPKCACKEDNLKLDLRNPIHSMMNQGEEKCEQLRDKHPNHKTSGPRREGDNRAVINLHRTPANGKKPEPWTGESNAASRKWNITFLHQKEHGGEESSFPSDSVDETAQGRLTANPIGKERGTYAGSQNI